MFSLPSLRSVLARESTTSVSTAPSTSLFTRLFTTTKASLKGKGQPSRKPKGQDMRALATKNVRRSRQPQRSDAYYRIAILKQNLFSPAPPPLRMARLRHLRHWTIHRAWMLFRRQQREALDAERGRMHAGMYNACEELRKTKGPSGKGEGYLYRVAMEKKGVWGMDAVPIEYGRFQTDSPAKEAWDHNWKR